jgi:hypothetical protein
LQRTSPFSSTSAAFVDVEPPSTPTQPRTTSPGVKVAGVNFFGLYCSRNAASSSAVLLSPCPPAAAFSSRRPIVM